MRNLVAWRGFALANLACALAATAWWAFVHQAGAWPLVIALIPWGIRVAAGKFPFQRTPLDIPVGVFLFTAGVGVWAAYDRTAAWDKVWLIVAAAVLYYALAGQPGSNGVIMACLAGLLGAGLSVYFLLTNDWMQFPADLRLLNRLGTAWMEIRPHVHGPIIQPNIAGGVLAMLLPISLPWIFHAWQKGTRGWRFAVPAITAILAAGLLMTSSRAAWIALLMGLGIWGWWYLSGFVARRWMQRRMLIFGLPLLLAVIVALGALGLRSGILVRAANVLPGQADASSRITIARNTIQLIRDYPFTGGGLAAFPSLYSTYMRVIQVPEFFYSHNLYLDVALEQGLPGLAAFLFLMAGTIWLLLRSLAADPSHNHLAAASLAGLAVVLLHGFLDDALYGMGGTPLLFFLPGIAASLWMTNEGRIQAPESEAPQGSPPSHRKSSPRGRGWAWGSLLVVLGLGSMALFLVKPLRSAWYANLGAVAMSRFQLLIWPDTLATPRNPQAKIEPIIDLFDKALAQNPNNPTALYRLGIFAYYGNDFVKAAGYLKSASTQNQGHRGIQKLLGYTYTWTGNWVEAQALLERIPEAREELNSYSWWWGTQNRADLAELASQMLSRLQK